MIVGCLYDEAWGEIEEMHDELIGMLCFDIELSENLLRKISHVTRHDDAGAAADGGCQYVAILRVGEDKTGNEVLVSCYQRVWRGLVH